MELITEGEIGRLRHYSSQGGFGIPKYAGEVVSVRFERSFVFEKDGLEHDGWKLPGDVSCSIWMMDSIGEFVDCVLDPENPALDGKISVSSEYESYLPRAKIDLNVVQASGTGIIVVTLNTKTSSIFEVMKDLTVHLDVINPSVYRDREVGISLEEEKEVWNVFSFSPTQGKTVYDVDDDWNSVAVMMFFVYADRWHMKALSHFSLTKGLNERIRDTKNLCYALNNIILRDLELPDGCISIRSLLLGDGGGQANCNNEDNLGALMLGLRRSQASNLEGPMLLRNSSSVADYKFLANKLQERKEFLKDFLLKHRDKITKGKVIIDNQGNIQYCDSNDFNLGKKDPPSPEESSYEESESEFAPRSETLESANKDIQILKQTVTEVQLQLVSIMDMFMATSPPSFTMQGTASEVTYKSILEEIQYMESALLLKRDEFVSKKAEISDKYIKTGNCQISALQPVISNSGYTQFIDRMEKLRQSVESYGSRYRQAVIDNKDLLNESREFAFNKIRSIESRFDRLNYEFNNFLFNISCSEPPNHIQFVN